MAVESTPAKVHDPLCDRYEPATGPECQCKQIKLTEERAARTAERIGAAYAWRNSERELVKRIAKEIRKG
jgi:hypothetical protein